ncbi:MAG: hypothetical protein KAJ14_00425, partial [Candidatus Omnitrophica bacterium]|nr:hypothetical protein [Candidatus Omnitrophota bacterium]
IKLGDTGETKSKTKENRSFPYRKFSPLYREKYLLGVESVQAVYTRHYGPNVDDYNKMFYLDFYYDEDNHAIGWEAKNLDGTLHIFDGTGIDFINDKQLTMWNDNGFAYYVDHRDDYITKNPDGTIYPMGQDTLNAMKWEDYLIELEEITRNVKSVTLKNGDLFKVDCLAFKGGVITDKGYYIPPSQIETLNGEGKSYEYIPSRRLGIWILESNGVVPSKVGIVQDISTVESLDSRKEADSDDLADNSEKYSVRSSSNLSVSAFDGETLSSYWEDGLSDTSSHIFKGRDGVEVSQITVMKDGESESFQVMTNSGQPKTIPFNDNRDFSEFVPKSNINFFDTKIPQIYTTPVINHNGQFDVFWWGLLDNTNNM